MILSEVKAATNHEECGGVWFSLSQAKTPDVSDVLEQPLHGTAGAELYGNSRYPVVPQPPVTTETSGKGER